jgi:hypothetical protein
MQSTAKPLLFVSLFSIAMAVLEAAVVVYLRALYYPDGFTVAFKIIDQRILLIELTRELATVLMLVAVGVLVGKTAKEKFAYFLISFAVWDVFYYVWLKVFINWPASLLDWDILFLIPFTWLGPVLAPVLCSFTMFALGIVLLNSRSGITPRAWMLLLSGTAIILYTFLVDYGTIIVGQGFYKDMANLLNNKQFIEIMSTYIPETYNWFLLGLGEMLILGAIGFIYKAREHKTTIYY